MAINTTGIEDANSMIGVLQGINNYDGGLTIFLLTLGVGVVSYLSFSNNYSFESSFMAASWLTTFVSILFFAAGLLAQQVMLSVVIISSAFTVYQAMRR